MFEIIADFSSFSFTAAEFDIKYFRLHRTFSDFVFPDKCEIANSQTEAICNHFVGSIILTSVALVKYKLTKSPCLLATEFGLLWGSTNPPKMVCEGEIQRPRLAVAPLYLRRTISVAPVHLS